MLIVVTGPSRTASGTPPPRPQRPLQLPPSTALGSAPSRRLPRVRRPSPLSTRASRSARCSASRASRSASRASRSANCSASRAMSVLYSACMVFMRPFSRAISTRHSSSMRHPATKGRSVPVLSYEGTGGGEDRGRPHWAGAECSRIKKRRNSQPDEGLRGIGAGGAR